MTADTNIARLTAELAAIDCHLREARAKQANLKRSSLIPSQATALAVHRSALPSSMLSELVASRDALVAIRSDAAKLHKTKGLLVANLQRSQSALQQSATENLEVIGATDRLSDNARHYRSPIEQNCEIDRLKSLLAEIAQTEQHLLAERLTQLAALSRISDQLGEYDELDWEHFRHNAEVGIKRQQIASISDELKSVRRIYDRKRRMLDRLEATDVVPDILMLEGEKKCQQDRLLKHCDQNQSGVSATHHRALLILQREAKLTAVGAAIQEVLTATGADFTDCADVEDASQFDFVRNKIRACKGEEDTLQQAIEYLDTQLTNLEARVDILSHSMTSLKREEETESQAQDRKMKSIEVDLRRQTQGANALVAQQRESRTRKEEKLTKSK